MKEFEVTSIDPDASRKLVVRASARKIFPHVIVEMAAMSATGSTKESIALTDAETRQLFNWLGIYLHKQ